MKMILVSVGTRGDMEPFLAIGEMLQQKGHQVICAFPGQFRDLAESAGLSFTSLGSKLIELLESDTGKAAMGGSSGLQKFLAVIKLARIQTASQKELVYKQYELIKAEKPDRVLYNGKAVYPIIWGLKNPGQNILISSLPYMHYVRNHTHVAFNGNFGPVLNKLTYALASFGMITTTKISAKWLKLPEKINRRRIRKALLTNRAIYMISPSFFPRPDYWPDHLTVMGYQGRRGTTDWNPDKTLTAFLDKHDRILFITFGSMTNPEPHKKTEMLIDILERNKIPAIVNTASGGLVAPEKYDRQLIHFVDRIPYDWIFPKMYGVIHHGGSGTTHLSIRYGCATMIIPHIIDQFVWNRIISRLGAGPEGIRINKLSVKNLEPKILALFNQNAFKKRAEQLALQMRKEDFTAALYMLLVQDCTEPT